MDWREVTIYTTTEGIGPVEALLEDNGVEGYVLEDAADFEEFLKDTEIYWDYVDEDLVREKRAQETCLKIYLPDSEEGAKQYADIRAALENLKARDEEHAWGRLCTETALTRQEDWEWGWKQYFKPFPVGKGFMIKPSWETVEDPQGRRILEIDPASSFGTGSHDTTQLCMCALEDNVKPGDTVLDCCAAPGGKSFAMAEKMQGKGSVASCDIYEHKLRRIREGASRLGLPNIRTELQDASVCREEWKDSADVVLCDVPCSGLGIIRKKPEIRFKNPDEIAGLPEIQAKILANCAQYVKKGGTLVYSTCTILQRENEDVVRAFLAENSDFEAVSWTHPVCGAREDGMVTLLPPVHDTDGFFIVKMKRK